MAVGTGCGSAQPRRHIQPTDIYMIKVFVGTQALHLSPLEQRGYAFEEGTLTGDTMDVSESQLPRRKSSSTRMQNLWRTAFRSSGHPPGGSRAQEWCSVGHLFARR